MMRPASLLGSRISGLVVRPRILLGSGPSSGMAHLGRRSLTQQLPDAPLILHHPNSPVVRANHPHLWVQNITKTAQQVHTSLSDVFRQALWHMGSTLKKRKAKMNKHKLRKRRKLARRKSK